MARFVHPVFPVLRLLGTVLTVLLAACGIETVPYIQPVDFDSTVLENDLLTFRHADENGDAALRDYFRGYVIYYKLYPNTSEGLDQADTDSDYIVEEPVSPDTDRLEARDFFPFVTDDDDLPHLEIDAEEPAIVISLDVAIPVANEEKDLVASWTTNAGTDYEVILRRESLSDDATSSTITFETAEPLWSTSRFELSDYDVARMMDDVVQDTIDSSGVIMVLFVLSYGIDGTFNAFYSEPTLIYGEVAIQYENNISIGRAELRTHRRRFGRCIRLYLSSTLLR